MESIPVLYARLEVPFWCSFRDPTNTNVHTTFRLPPPTALYGLVANALELPQDDYSLRTLLRFAIRIERAGELVESYSKIMKYSRTEDIAAKGTTFGSTTVIKQKIIRPAFSMYISSDEDTLGRVKSALHNPARPLYLGESDDVVDVIQPEILNTAPVQTNCLDCAVPGVLSPGQVVNLPYQFSRRGRGDWALKRRLYTYRLDGTSLTTEMITAYEIAGRSIIFEPPISE